MSDKNKKQFGIWMDSHHATIVGRTGVDTGDFVILGHVKNDGAGNNSNESTAHHLDQALTHKFFKEISFQMQNVDEVHVTGTGIAQEQFKKYMAETPQFRNAVVKESTSNKMSDEKLIALFEGEFK